MVFPYVILRPQFVFLSDFFICNINTSIGVTLRCINGGLWQGSKNKVHTLGAFAVGLGMSNMNLKLDKHASRGPFFEMRIGCSMHIFGGNACTWSQTSIHCKRQAQKVFFFFFLAQQSSIANGTNVARCIVQLGRYKVFKGKFFFFFFGGGGGGVGGLRRKKPTKSAQKILVKEPTK